jgi:hypothetical protein
LFNHNSRYQDPRYHIFQCTPVDLSRWAFRQFRYEKYPLRDLVVGQVVSRIVAQYVLANRSAISQRDKCHDEFAIRRVGDSDDACFEYLRVLVENLLHFLRRNVGSSADDDLFLASLEPEVAVGIAGYQVAGMQSAVPEERIRGGGIVPVTGAICGASHHDLADFPFGKLSIVEVYDAELYERIGNAQ